MKFSRLDHNFTDTKGQDYLGSMFKEFIEWSLSAKEKSEFDLRANFGILR